MNRYALGSTLLFGAGFLSTVVFMQFDPDDYVALDTAAASFAHPFQTLPWVEFFTAITTIGGITGIIALAVLLAFFLRHERVQLLRLAIILIGASASAQLVKAFIDRVRPAAIPWLGQLHSFSFPSGHATTAMAFFGFLAVMCLSRLSTRVARFSVLLACALLILAIGGSRIVLAAHYFSDVLAGYLLGAFWVSLGFLIPLSPRLLSRSVR